MAINRSITAVVGDITQATTDAIVNAANTDLWMGGGVAGAIKQAGGEEVEREAMTKGPIRLGEAVATTAGHLPMAAVIHAAAMGFTAGRMIPPSRQTIGEATRASLEVADRLKLTSIAFPALGTGVGGFDLAEAAAVMVDAVNDYFSRSESHVRRVVFVLRDEHACQIFRGAIEYDTRT
ncbi:MAG TPA: macro domain-containing protein [Nitrolancea sp.]|jgi:O-acetyl-ADP-ribose deacetylase (regulator of RNase III)|nr:macro domain-containing protein [Nitrolancea sp.]